MFFLYCNESANSMLTAVNSFLRYSTIMAGTAVSLIPIIILFIFTQKYFVESFASSGVKG